MSPLDDKDPPVMVRVKGMWWILGVLTILALVAVLQLCMCSAYLVLLIVAFLFGGW